MNTTTDAVAAIEQPSVNDWRALGDLIELATERLTAPVEGIHDAIADRWFGHAADDDPSGNSTHQHIKRRVYGSLRLAGSVTKATLVTGATTIGRHRPVHSLWDSSMGAGIQAAANALWGDEFEQRASPMHMELSIRDSNGASIASGAAALTRAYPSSSGRLAVLLHGLGKTEHCWNSRIEDSKDIIGVAQALEADSFTPVLIRYNTGRSVPDNGDALASLLEQVTTNWPVAVDGIVLIGHSMGGLVARSSLHAGESADHSWVKYVQHSVGLGTPHFGSPIEKGVHIASQLLDRSELSRPLGQFIDGRSAGIKGMRHGTIHSMDRDDQPIDPHGVDQHNVASTISGDASHPLGALVGDLVVRVNSATGMSSDSEVPATNTRVFGGLNHLSMLHDPGVLSQIRDWLTPLHPDSIKATT